MTEEPATMIRPTRRSEWTMIGALIALCLLALIFGAMILFPRWPDLVSLPRIDFLGYALILSVIGILLMIIAFASPYIGSVRMSGMGAELDLKGTAPSAISNP